MSHSMTGWAEPSAIAARYLGYWGLKFPPFGPDWSAARFFLSTSAEEALARVEFAVERGYRGVFIAGPPGVGKTWLLYEMGWRWRRPGNLVVNLPARGRSRDILLVELAIGLGITGASMSPVRLWREVSEVIAAAVLSHQTCLLMFDDIDRTGDGVLEMLGALSEVVGARGGPTLILTARSGGPRPGMGRALDWVDLKLTLEPWEMDEVTAFVRERFSQAGQTADRVFTEEAIRQLFVLTGGRPRDVNHLGEWCLVAAAGAEVRPIDEAFVQEVYAEFYRHLDEDWKAGVVSAGREG